MKLTNEIVFYQPKDSSTTFEVNIADETIWLNQQQIVDLFASSKANISEHLKNIFLSGELNENSVVRNFRTTATDGKKYNVKHYNLDVIISIGYRVNSIRGTQFRIWANQILKDYLLKGYSLNNRMNRMEDDIQALNEKVGPIDLQISELTGLIKSFNERLAQQMPLLEDEIERLISSGNAENSTIENYLDTLLSLTMHGFGDDLFIRLLEYYKTIDLDGALFYWNEYDKQE